MQTSIITISNRRLAKRIGLPLAVSAIVALSGCAGKMVWSPELEEARAMYHDISNNPLIATHASAELAVAEQQLQKAIDAANYFKGRSTIAHEANLAKTQILIAQQRVRATRAQENLQVAIATQKQSNAQLAFAAAEAQAEIAAVAAVAVAVEQEPVMAAALPDQQQQPHPLSDMRIARLQERIDELERKVAQQNQPVPAIGAALPVQLDSDQPATDIRLASLTERLTKLERQTQNPSQPAAPSAAAEVTLDEPVIAAAIAAPATPAAKPAAVAINQEIVEASRELQETLHAMNAHPGPKGMTLTLSDRYFDGNTARLWNQRATRHLDRVASVLNENNRLKLVIEGYTDNLDAPDLNHNLSADRAIAVKTALIQRGIEASRISALGYGDTKPIASNSSPSGRLKNRRVELIFPDTLVAVQ